MSDKQLWFRICCCSAVITMALIFATGARAQATERVLYSFTGGRDGSTPEAGLAIDTAGNLYGTTAFGGDMHCPDNSAGCGTVFQLTPNPDGSWTENVLARFNGTNGAYPSAAVILDPSGNLFGTTQVAQPLGDAFEVTQASGVWTLKVIFRFGLSVGGGGIPGDSLVRDPSGNLYGTTRGGGRGGVIFELTPNPDGTWSEIPLRNLGLNADGGEINQAPLILDAQGNLYGTTYGDSTNQGTHPLGSVFELSPGSGGWTGRVLHAFTGGIDGCHPLAGLTFDNSGNLYGTTSSCGSTVAAVGTVFRLTPNPDGSWTESVLHNFASTSDGFGPASAPVFDQAGNLYGTAGGGLGFGVVYKLTPSTQGQWTYSVVYKFTGSPDGSSPSGLVIDQDGHVYGTTMSGGAFSRGSVFEVTP
jgi:uncharacterized repeat protein (TIGR03803 family)